MADYSGYFLKGLGSGLQTGMNLGTQIQEMKWQKKQRKELEEKQAKMTEVSNLWNAKIKEIYTDNKATDEEISQLTTIYLSGGYEFMDHYQGAMNAIKSMNEKAYNQEIEWINLFIETSAGLPSGDIQAAFDIITPYVTSEKGRNTLEAYNNLQKKRTEALQAQPEDIWGQAGTLPQDVRPDYLRSKGIDIPQPATAQPTEMDLMAETTKKLDAAYATGNANYFNQMAKSLNMPTTFDTYKQKYEKPGGGTPDSLNTAEYNLKQKIINEALVTDSIEEKNAKLSKAEKDLGFKIELSDEEWTQAKKADIDALVQVLDEITAGTPDNRNVKGNVEYTFNLDMGDGPEEVTKTGEEWYELVLESYNALIKILEEQGIDVSQYKLLKPLSEIKKANKWTSGFVGSGVTAGDLIKIYY